VTFKTSTFAVYQMADTAFVGYFPIHPDSSEIPYTAVLGAFDDAPFVEVHVPNGGESWVGGNRQITWKFTDDSGRDSVSVFWSLNSGGSWPFMIGHGITADSSWTWSVPGYGSGSSHSRIAVLGYDGNKDQNYDMSDGDLYISSPSGGQGVAFRDRQTGQIFDGEPWSTESKGGIGFNVPGQDRVTVEVFDVAGRRLRLLLDEVVEAGPHEVQWDLLDGSGRHVGAGVYFYRVSTASRQSVGKFVVVR
jgi:hypothetical protein